MKIKNTGFLIFFLVSALTSSVAEIADLTALENLAIPQSLGKVESKFKGTGERWIVHVQDVHAHLTAQQNISALIDHLQNAYGIKTVAIEGTWYHSSLPKSWAVPPSREKQMLAQALLEEDYINGAIYSAIFSKTPLYLVGLEEESLYWENGRLYLKYLDDQETIHTKLGLLEQKIQTAKENVYHPDLLNFDRSLGAFRSGKKAETFIPALLKLSAAKNTGLEDLSQIQTFLKALEIEKSIDRQKLEGEAKRLMKTYKYANLHFEELLQSGKIPAEKLEFYPQTQQYLELMKIQGEIQHRIFFQEIETAIERLKEKLLQTTEETDLDKRSEAFILAKKIITLQATPKDVKAFHLRQADIAAELQNSELEEALDNGLKFYETAQKRDEAFFEKIVNDPKLQGDIAIVTGGFHTEGLSEQLEKSGVSYIVVSPDLGKDEPVNDALYFKRIRENFSTQHAMTDYPPEALKRDVAFARAEARLRSESRDLQAAKKVYETYQIGEPDADVKPISNESVSLDALSTDELEKQRNDAMNLTQRMTAIMEIDELVDHLNDLQYGSLNEAALLDYLSHPERVLFLTGDVTKIPTFLFGRRNVKKSQNPMAKIVAEEQKKLAEQDIPIAVIGRGRYSPDSKVVHVEAFTAIFSALPLILTHREYVSVAGALMERLLSILQALYNVRATGVAA